MKKHAFQYLSQIEIPLKEIFAWYLRPGAIERMTPPWIQSKLLFREGGPDKEGSKVGLLLQWGPFHKKWVLQHTGYKEGEEFSDLQIEGPFSYWKHTHRLTSLNASRSVVSDEISYSLPLLHSMVQKKLIKAFRYRHETLKQDLVTLSRYPTKKQLKVLISGASGLVGSAVSAFLRAGGHDVWNLARYKGDEKSVVWDPNSGRYSAEDFEGFDAVIHLAGENIAGKSWTPKQKNRLFQSRCRDTWLLSQILEKLKKPPKTMICASAVGIYGNRRGEDLSEKSAPGEGFLADLCQRWESATQAIENKGTRVLHMRFGYIVSSSGGMLKKMLFPFKMGLGGPLGDGRQVMPWVSLDDVVGAIYHVLMKEDISGAVNVVAPHPVSQKVFARTLGKVLHRPAILPVPKWVLRLTLGERADALLLTSAHVHPHRLLDSGFIFRYPHLEEALRHTL